MRLFGCQEAGNARVEQGYLYEDISISLWLITHRMAGEVSRACVEVDKSIDTLFSVATEFLTALEEKKLEKTLTHFDQTVDSLLLRLVMFSEDAKMASSTQNVAHSQDKACHDTLAQIHLLMDRNRSPNN
ncbi:hypothetical protein AAMO2058_001679800 [Amorphochlora amoebiformis]